MGLTQYKKKRDFKSTPEPTGGKADASHLRFVIQKHDASHLHYDFRLEMEGVLKSWAVPKGPSTDPSIKRLAMMVEDHPYDYRNFEGIIPSGYGAGTVMVWDEGYYTAAEDDPKHKTATNKKDEDKALRRQLHLGKLKITLHGKKLKGDYALVKAKGRGENAWLLFKIKDAYASTVDITAKDKSVLSKKTIAQLEKTSKNFYGAQRVREATTKSKKEIALNKRADVKAASKRNAADKTKGTKTTASTAGRKAAFFTSVKPMLATLVDKPFDEPGWLYEIKWDGYRAVAFKHNRTFALKSRNDKDFDKKFYPITDALKAWDIDAIVDGEIVVLDSQGVSNFGALQNWRSEADGELYYYVFDLLWLNGRDLRSLPLTERRAMLEPLVPAEGNIRYSKAVETSGTEFFEAAKKMGLEGIMAKKADSEYETGDRSSAWLKIKANKRQEMIDGGFTRNDDSSKLFSSLLVGVYDKGRLHYTGKVGTGFNEKMQKEMMAAFKKRITTKPPFTELPDINKPSRFRPNPPHATATWLKPELVCEVSYTEMTSDGVMRHPSFEGMRSDKKATEVTMEKPAAVQKAVAAADNTNTVKPAKNILERKQAIVKTGKTNRKTLLNPTDDTQTKKLNGHELVFKNLHKLYWPKEKITKRDLLDYYYQVAPYILPYLKDRPQSMLRHPDGINGESFFFKDITGKAPSWLQTYTYHSDADNRDSKYLVAKDEASLLYMASLGCIEMNPWHSRVQKEDYPDWCIIDLDPAKNSFDQVIEAAITTKEVLEELEVTAYPKTSGSTGIHIYIPLAAKYTYEQSKEFGRVIATLVQQRLPGFTSIQRAVKDRKGKMYIDFLQNRPQATVAAPYAVRPKSGATVSMPLEWSEVKKGLQMADFTIFNALDRIKAKGDIFKPVLGKGINMQAAIKKYQATTK